LKFSRCDNVKYKINKKIAIIGAGPAGLGAAGVLICKGYEVHVFDALPEPGGLLLFGIPGFRVPKKNVREGVEDLRRLGVIFHVNKRVVEGDKEEINTIGFDLLVKNFDAVIIATGTWEERKLGVEGEDLKGVYPALSFLFEYSRAELGYIDFKELPSLGDKVAVIGGGLTAVDAAEVSHRLGAKEVYMIYRRTINEAPAKREIERLIKTGIKWIELATPKRFLGDENKRLRKIELIRMRLGEPDHTGRPRPIPIEGSETYLDVDSVLVAIGEIPTPPFKMHPEIKFSEQVNGFLRHKKFYFSIRNILYEAGSSSGQGCGALAPETGVRIPARLSHIYFISSSIIVIIFLIYSVALPVETLISDEEASQLFP
jgi:glutamate synthase (NADPH/NADH) small chain